MFGAGGRLHTQVSGAQLAGRLVSLPPPPPTPGFAADKTKSARPLVPKRPPFPQASMQPSNFPSTVPVPAVPNAASSKTDEIKAKLRAWHSRVKTGKQPEPPSSSETVTIRRAPPPPPSVFRRPPLATPGQPGSLQATVAPPLSSASLATPVGNNVASLAGSFLGAVASTSNVPVTGAIPLGSSSGLSASAKLHPAESSGETAKKDSSEALSLATGAATFSGPLSLSEILRRKKSVQTVDKKNGALHVTGEQVKTASTQLTSRQPSQSDGTAGGIVKRQMTSVDGQYVATSTHRLPVKAPLEPSASEPLPVASELVKTAVPQGVVDEHENTKFNAEAAAQPPASASNSNLTSEKLFTDNLFPPIPLESQAAEQLIFPAAAPVAEVPLDAPAAAPAFLAHKSECLSVSVEEQTLNVTDDKTARPLAERFLDGTNNSAPVEVQAFHTASVPGEVTLAQLQTPLAVLPTAGDLSASLPSVQAASETRPVLSSVNSSHPTSSTFSEELSVLAQPVIAMDANLSTQRMDDALPSAPTAPGLTALSEAEKPSYVCSHDDGPALLDEEMCNVFSTAPSGATPSLLSVRQSSKRSKTLLSFFISGSLSFSLVLCAVSGRASG